MGLKIDCLKNYNTNYQHIDKTNAKNSNISFGKFSQYSNKWNNSSVETRKSIASLVVAGILMAVAYLGRTVQNKDTQQKDIQTNEIAENIDKSNLNKLSIVASFAEPVKKRSITVTKEETLWNIAKNECDSVYGKGNYSAEDLNDKVRYLAKLNEVVRGVNDACIVHEGDEIVIQEEGHLCDVIINGAKSKCFLNKKGEAWVIKDITSQNSENSKKLIYMNNVQLTKNFDGSISFIGNAAEDPRYLDFQVINPQCRHEQNQYLLFDE